LDTLVKIGEKAPQFILPDLDDKQFSLDGWNGWIRVLYFWSAECIWCERVDRELIGFINSWEGRVKCVWIASNANETHELITKVAKARDIPSVLFDEGHRVADQYEAQVTPHFFIVDAGGKLAYQGAWDDITFRKRVATQVYVPQVVQALREGSIPGITQTPAYGCELVRYPEPPA